MPDALRSIDVAQNVDEQQHVLCFRRQRAQRHTSHVFEQPVLPDKACSVARYLGSLRHVAAKFISKFAPASGKLMLRGTVRARFGTGRGSYANRVFSFISGLVCNTLLSGLEALVLKDCHYQQLDRYILKRGRRLMQGAACKKSQTEDGFRYSCQAYQVLAERGSAPAASRPLPGLSSYKLTLTSWALLSLGQSSTKMLLARSCFCFQAFVRDSWACGTWVRPFHHQGGLRPLKHKRLWLSLLQTGGSYVNAHWMMVRSAGRVRSYVQLRSHVVHWLLFQTFAHGAGTSTQARNQRLTTSRGPFAVDLAAGKGQFSIRLLVRRSHCIAQLVRTLVVTWNHSCNTFLKMRR